MWPLYLTILCVPFTVPSVLCTKASDIDVNNLLSISNNVEKPMPFIEFYNSETDNWQTLPTANINITDYGVAIYKNQLSLIGGLHNSNSTNTVNEVDLLSGQIKTVNYLNQPRTNPSVAVVGEGKLSTLYIMGGKLESGEVTAIVERWDESTQEWIQLTPMLIACENAAVVVHNNDIYVIGGFNGSQYMDTVQVYNVTSEMWTVKRSMEVTKGQFHGVSDGRYIFVVGGFTDHLDPNSALNSVDRYDPENEVWISIANISFCSGSVGVNLLNDQLYAIGGTNCKITQIYHQNNNTWQIMSPLTYERTSHTTVKVPFELKDYQFDWIPGNRSMKDILVFGVINSGQTAMERYYPEKDYWQAMDHENTDTRLYRAAFVNNRLIIAGGLSDNITGIIMDKVFEIFPDTGRVRQLSSMKHAREFPSLVTVGEGKSVRLYAIGGGGGGGIGSRSSVERWDPFTDTWEFVSPMNIPRSRTAAVQHEGNIYVFGGVNITGALNDTEVYLTDWNRWEYRTPMIHKTRACSAASDGKYIYVVGGSDVGSVFNYVQRYDSSTNTWKMLANTTSSYMVTISLLDNIPIVFGGSEVTEIYDAEKDEWRKLASMNFRRQTLSALQVPWKWKYPNLV